MSINISAGISGFAVFIQGLLSFFSPCVLPIIPLYLGYLSGGAPADDESAAKRQGRVFLNTLFFVIGVSFAIFLLGLGMSLIGSIFGRNRVLFARIGGVIVILFGLYQLGVFGGRGLLSEEKRLPFTIDRMAMSPLAALIMGFLFSFAWTPCVGPALSSVLLMAAGTSDRAGGYLLLALYTLGFSIPFLLLGVFTTGLLELIKKHRGVVRYTAKIGGVLLILMGLLMVTGYMNSVTGFLARASTRETETAAEASEQPDETNEAPAPDTEEAAAPEENEEVADRQTVPAVDFELLDQYGATHKLEDYRGRVIFLNFWATWCPPCRSEMPDIQKLYEEYGADSEIAVILSVATPGFNGEGSEEEIRDFLDENGYTYPVLMDSTGELMMAYGISAIPTTFMIDAEGNVFGYVPGAMDLNSMRYIIEETVKSS